MANPSSLHDASSQSRHGPPDLHRPRDDADPARRGPRSSRTRCSGPGWAPSGARGQPPPPALPKLPDAVLISHLHRDHLDIPSLRRVPSKTPIVVPRGAARLVEKAGPHPIVELGRGETVSVGEVEVTAVPAEHGGRRGRWGSEIEPLGYVIRNEGRSVYFAGDTDLFDEMSEVGPVDVALLPVWGWGPSVGEGHLDPETAARALTLVRPAAGRPDPLGDLLSRRRQAVAAGAAGGAAARVRPACPGAGARGRGEGSAARLRDVVGGLMRGLTPHQARNRNGGAGPPPLAADRAGLLGGRRPSAQHRRPQLRRRAGHHRADRDPPRAAVAAA